MNSTAGGVLAAMDEQALKNLLKEAGIK